VSTAIEVQHADPQAPVVVTESAVRHFRQQIQAAKAAGLRLSIKESGCTGYMYVMDLVETPPAEPAWDGVRDRLQRAAASG